MKQELNKLITLKKNREKKLSDLKTKYLAIVYGGLVFKKTDKEIHKELYDETINQKRLGLPYDDLMFKNAKKLVKKVKKEIGSEEPPHGIVTAIFLAEKVFQAFNKTKATDFLSQNIYNNSRKFEAEQKDYIINKTIVDGRSKTKVFFLASEHSDSAEDHKHEQGKIYVDAKWRTFIKDPVLTKQIEDYIKKNGVDTIQSITHKPVWFITRPNCRHYFKSVRADEVLSASLKKLIEKYDMHSEIGDKSVMQTMAHSLKKEWYEQKNIKAIIAKYRERLKLHKALYKVQPSELLKNAITKDMFLIKKWESYLRSHFR